MSMYRNSSFLYALTMKVKKTPSKIGYFSKIAEFFTNTKLIKLLFVLSAFNQHFYTDIVG